LKVFAAMLTCRMARLLNNGEAKSGNGEFGPLPAYIPDSR
jgi:hypothetical protein